MKTQQPLFIQETFVNRTKDAIFGESDTYEAFTDDPGKLYRSLRSEYGRCTGRVYVDGKDGKTRAIGWVFIKRMRYEDARTNGPESYYLREVWVSLRTGPSVTRVEHSPAFELSVA